MKTYVALLSLVLNLILPSTTYAGAGQDHSHGEVVTEENDVQEIYFSSEVSSDKYELLLRYKPIHTGEEMPLLLFISDYETNKPINEAQLNIVAQEDPNISFSIHQDGNGMYRLKAIFPEAKTYSLAVHIDGQAGLDLMLLEHIAVGVDFPDAHETEHAHLFSGANWYLIGFALLVGLGLGWLLRKGSSSQQKNSFSIILILIGCSIPLQTTTAHGGEEHDAGAKGNNFSNTVPVPKESQFLFDIYTQKVAKGSFKESSHLFGTIFPSSNGKAFISADQNGIITKINVSVGQQVTKGQTLATVQKTVDVGTRKSMQSEANILAAEYDAAKKEVSRLTSISDIAAQKDIDEATSRLQKAENNLALFNNNSGETITLTAPISGILGNFKLSIGATVMAGEPIFTVTDLSLLYVEAQVFDRDADKILPDATYILECVNDKDKHVSRDIKLLSKAMEINATNQSQKVLFQVENPDEVFKIGEFVNIRVFASSPSQQITLPNSAITEINGKPVVFVKDSAEKFTVRYVQLGDNNGTHTSIVKGVEEGERVVVNGSYQLKMIFLNQ
jgi:cobalt-zinc-cadmium efflux system membrane fusion protein